MPRNRGALALAHKHILNRIISGDFLAGAAVAEVSLATELGISRTPVREAIGQLVAEGMLQRSSRGVVVAEPTRQDIIELYELREALEVYAIGKIAGRHLSPRALEPLEALVEELRTIATELQQSGKPALEGEALRRFVAADMRFHTLLLQSGGNQRMLKILDSTSVLLRIFSLPRERHTARLVGEVYRFHRRILDAVAKGSRTEAMQLLGEHIQVSLEERLAEYEDPQQAGREW
ncbi:MAG: GntR family transcriptional regulator [Chthoniobacter sp.]|nr:GntR family transcriptional regulator [Chthoniobacter sp.]